MNVLIIVALIGAWGTVMAAWIDSRRRTNGHGPLARHLRFQDAASAKNFEETSALLTEHIRADLIVQAALLSTTASMAKDVQGIKETLERKDTE